MKYSVVFWKFLIICGLAFGGQKISAQTFPFVSALKNPVELQLERPAGKVQTVKAEVGGKSYSFLFDSGGGTTTLTPEVAKELNCRPIGRGIGFRATGERVEGPRCENIAFRIGAFATVTDVGLHNIMAYFDKDTPPLGGMISLQTFENYPVTLDLANNKIIVETDQSLAVRVAGMKQINTRLSRQVGGSTLDVFVAAETPKDRIWLELDSGNYGPVFLARHAVEQLGANLDAPNKARLTLPIKLDLEGYGTVEMPARERDIIYDGQLNFDTMHKFVITIDLRTGKTWIKSNQTVN